MPTTYFLYRVSTEKQSAKRQIHAGKKFAKKHKIEGDIQIVEEQASGARTWKKREVGKVVHQLVPGDVLIFDDITRIGRNMYEVNAVLAEALSRKARVMTMDPFHDYKDDVHSQVYAFAFSLAAQLQREFISRQTKSALEAKRAEGVILGRPKGSIRINPKVDEHRDQIRELKEVGTSDTAIAKLIGVSRTTLIRNWKKIEDQD